MEADDYKEQVEPGDSKEETLTRRQTSSYWVIDSENLLTENTMADILSKLANMKMSKNDQCDSRNSASTKCGSRNQDDHDGVHYRTWKELDHPDHQIY